MRLPKRVRVGPDMWFAVIQKPNLKAHIRGKTKKVLGCLDIKKATVFIEKNQHIVGKFHILLHELIHMADEKNKMTRCYKKGLTEKQVTLLTGGLFPMLAYSGLIKGINKGMQDNFLKKLKMR